MCSLLIVFLLVIETSAAQDIERPSRGFGDSVQICSNERGVWRIRTHAVDFTVDAQPLTGIAPDDVEAFAEREVRERHGPAILRKVTVIGADSRSGMRPALRRQHLAARSDASQALEDIGIEHLIDGGRCARGRIEMRRLQWNAKHQIGARGIGRGGNERRDGRDD